uniref:Uncharacterized protein n=1 Tax=viral metagenome TaxID=1070528 RepID=A0A6C0J366_9ZZZZ
MVATRRGRVLASKISQRNDVKAPVKPPSLDGTAFLNALALMNNRQADAPKKREVYGQAIFQDKTGAIRTGEKNAKFKREFAMVESPFKHEVKVRINLLGSLKKMIQKIVTGAQPKRCPSGRTTCAEKEKVKGPYLVSLSTVAKLAEIMRLTPYDGPTRGQRMLKRKKERVDANAVRRGLIANVYTGRKTLSDVKSIRKPFSRLITDLDVQKFRKRKNAAARGAIKAKKTKANKKATQTQRLKNIGARSSSNSEEEDLNDDQSSRSVSSY